MRPLTEAEKADDRELKRLAAKIAKRDAIRLGKEGAKLAKQGGRALWSGTKQLASLAQRRMQRMRDEKKAKKAFKK